MPRHIDRLESRRLMYAAAFEINSEVSSLTISAKADFDAAGDVDLDSQVEKLDTAQLAGTLVADFSAKGIRFNGGSSIRAVEHEGDFDPGHDDAAFAVDGKIKKLGITLADVNAAIRNLTLDITGSSRKAPEGSKHRFQLRKGEISITSGTLDYQLDSKFGDADGSENLADLSSDLANGLGRVTGKKGSRVLTVPIEVRYTEEVDDGKVTFVLKGQVSGNETRSASGASLTVNGQTFSAAENGKKRITVDELLQSV